MGVSVDEHVKDDSAIFDGLDIVVAVGAKQDGRIERPSLDAPVVGRRDDPPRGDDRQVIDFMLVPVDRLAGR
jgi:hypothetical protein